MNMLCKNFGILSIFIFTELQKDLKTRQNIQICLLTLQESLIGPMMIWKKLLEKIFCEYFVKLKVYGLVICISNKN